MLNSYFSVLQYVANFNFFFLCGLFIPLGFVHKGFPLILVGCMAKIQTICFEFGPWQVDCNLLVGGCSFLCADAFLTLMLYWQQPAATNCGYC